MREANKRSLEDRLARLAPDAPDELKSALRSRISVLAAKAARVAGKHRIAGLEPELVDTFERFMKEKDPGCAAKTEGIKALVALEYPSPGVFLRGVRHIQMEASFGPPIDTAGGLRGACAMGLAQANYPGVYLEIVDMLTDREPIARVGAARAIGMTGREEGTWLLRLCVLKGEDDPDVLAECFAVLLHVAARDSLAFVTKYLDGENPAIAETAALALGESRIDPAFGILKERLAVRPLPSMRRTLMNAIALLRHEDALEFLEQAAAEGDQHAKAALELIRR